MIEPLSILTAFLLGLSGSGHCLVMCGGIAAGIGSQQSNTLRPLLFNLGRILTYTFSGVLIASMGFWLKDQHIWLMYALRTIAGILLILMGLYIARWQLWLTRLEQLGQYIWNPIKPMIAPLMQSQNNLSAIKLGMLWGFLPCGLIYSTLTWVGANQAPLMGGIAMLFFGLGTLPAMLTSSFAAKALLSMMQKKWIKQASGLLLIGYGVWTLFSVWQHFFINTG